MHRIRHLESGTWAVLDEDDAVVFRGTLRQCEDWLDLRENQQRPRRSLMQRLLRLLAAPFRRPKSSDSSANDGE